MRDSWAYLPRWAVPSRLPGRICVLLDGRAGRRRRWGPGSAVVRRRVFQELREVLSPGDEGGCSCLDVGVEGKYLVMGC
jgi:hypothetical protein